MADIMAYPCVPGVPREDFQYEQVERALKRVRLWHTWTSYYIDSLVSQGSPRLGAPWLMAKAFQNASTCYKRPL